MNRGFAVFVYKGELHIAHGMDAAQQLTQRMTDAVASGEATGVLVSALDNAVPVVSGYLDSDFWFKVANSIKDTDYNALTRDTLAGMFGIIAGTLTIPAGPAASLAADYLASEMYTRTYDLITKGTAGWRGEFLDYLERGGTIFPEYHVDPTVNMCYAQARAWTPPRDPLVLDLDGDGIEALGIDPSNPVLFDHDADGVRTATGWVKGDDGLLAMDLDGNGTIDSGRELFGDNTLLANGSTASNGFQAVAQYDTTGDGKIDAADAAYSQLRVWRDANGDGISQGSELKGLADLNISSINVVGQATNINLGNGNSQPWSGSFTRTDGSTGNSGTPELSGSLLLASNNFYREFTDDPVVTSAALGLPQMTGSGWVRDLRQAISMGTSDAQALEQSVAGYAGATSRDAQLSQVDALVSAWARTSGRLLTSTHRYSLVLDGGTLVTADPGTSYNGIVFTIRLQGEGLEQTVGIVGGTEIVPTDAGREVLRRLNVLEVFNGTKFFNIAPPPPQDVTIGDGTGGSGGGGVIAAPQMVATLSAAQIGFINQSYEALRESVYDSLVVQTRLMSYLDSVEYVFTETGLEFDTAAMEASLEARRLVDERSALIDLVELHKFAGSTLVDFGMADMSLLRSWIAALPPDSVLRAELASLGVVQAQDATPATQTSNLYLGDGQANRFNAGGGNDVVEGGAGNDTLFGGIGNDILNGGGGNDLLVGGDDSGSWNGSNYYRGSGDDTYLFGKGDGQDTIWDYDTASGNVDTISLKEGVAPSEVRLTRPGNGDHLVLHIVGTSDTLTVGNFFAGDGAGFAVERIMFADGTTWELPDIRAKALLSTESADDLTAYASADSITGAGGNDRIWARAGDDVVDAGTGNDQVWGEDGNDGVAGGEGNDSLYGQNGNDTLSGDAGADTLMGGLGNDLIDGGSGNDLLLGADDSGSWNGSNYYRGQGNDTYLFGKGDGQDTIWDVDTTVGNFDTISLKEGVAPSEVRLTRPGNGDHLVLSIAGTTDSLTVGNYFSGDATGGFAIEQIVFADGTTWDVEAIKARALLSSEAADDITGFASVDVINGAGGNDRIWGRGGNDVIDGGTGNDQLMGEDGDDDLRAGDGNDSVYGQNGNDLLSGGTGADTLMGGLGNDTIDSGTGNDLLLGADDSGSWNGSNYFRGQGNDTYLFGKGDGQDTIWDVDTTTGNIDTISLKEGVTPAEVRLTRPGNGDHLVLSIAGTTDSLTVGNYFSGDATGGFAIEQIVFADGTTWDVEAIKARALLSSEAADDITGFASNDAIAGAGGNDRIWGRGGNDVIDGGTGNDQLMGEDGDDDLRAGDGNDSLYGHNGNDLLSGGTGADTLMGGLGNDTIDSGTGNDLMLGADDSGSWNGSNYFRGQGNDTYLFGKGDGQDTIWDVDTTVGNFDTISLKEGVLPSEVRLTRPGNGDHLVLSIAGTTDSLTVGNYFSGDATAGFAIEQIVFADGTTWDVEAIKARALLSSEAADDITGFASNDAINGAGGNDRIWGRGGNDVIDGGAGNDQLMGEDGDDDLRAGDGNDSVYGQNGNDLLSGGTGADTLMGGLGNDTIDSGAGNDLMLGADDSGSWNGSNYFRGQGNDTYLFGKGDGQDTIWDVDTTTGNIDTISLKEGVLPSEVRLTRPGNGDHLVLSIAGTTDTLTVGNYFSGDATAGFAIEQIVFADGTTWNVDAIKTRVLLSSEVADDITGFASADVINGAGGDDRVWGRAGNDVIDGGTGNDQLRGEDGDDDLKGADGNDALYGENGNDTLAGGAGIDTLMGGLGNDVIDSGAGNDLLLGADDSGSWNGSNYYRGQGNDTFLFGKGDGQDNVWDYDTTVGNMDTIRLKDGVLPSEVRLSRPGNGNNLLLAIAGTTDTLTVGNFFVGDGGGGFAIEQIVFADGTTWNLDTIKAKAATASATENADDITGYAYDDVIDGAGGNDRIWGRAGNDILIGGAGNDQLRGEDGNDDLQGGDGADSLYGESGNDTLRGGTGTDTLMGGVGNDLIDGGSGNDLLLGADDSGSWNGSNYIRGLGNDTYLFGKGDGQDTIWDYDTTTGNFDTISLKEGVTPAEVRLTRPGNVDHLILSIAGTTDTLTVGNYFSGDAVGGFAIEQIVFADGTTWDVEAIKARVLLSSEAADDITGFASADVINGAGGNDRIWARAGNDTIDAGTGNDQVWGEDGNDGIVGGDGNDSLYGQNGNDTLFGGTGADTLMGGLGDDRIDSGAGNDLMLGADDSGSWNGSNYYRGQGNDTYLFGKGDGQDTIWDVDTTTGNVDTISLKEGVLPSEVRLTRPGNGDHLVLSIAGTTDTLTIGNYFSGDATAGFAIEQIVLADGTTWDVEAIKARALLSSEAADDITGFASADVINGAGGNDRIWGRAGNDTIDAGTGNDQVWGEDGNDGIVGGDGNDTLYGQNGNDTLSGGTGADTLMGGLGNDLIDGGSGNDLLLGADDSGSWNGSNYYRGQGNDTYLFGKGDGQDTIWDVDTTTGNIDTISLKEGVTPAEVRLTRPGNTDHLVLSILGTSDSITVGNYFSGDAVGGFAIEQIVFADGTTWDVEAIKSRALLPSEGADDISGFATADVINGAGGNDRIWARAGNDSIDAGTGNDQVWGEDGNDGIVGGDGNDSLYGQNGNDTLFGGTGADTLMGGVGNDVIDSGAGNDLLLGADDSGSWNGSNYYRGQGNDTYLFGKGDGQDTIWDVDTTTGNIDTVSLKEGVTPAEVRLTRPGNSDHLVLSILGTSDSITVGNYFAGDAVGGFAIEQIVFADGTTWDVEAIKSRALLPSEGADDISGFATADVINGAGGNDRIWARAGNDSIDAGTGNDQVWGEDGNDSVFGGDGNDSLYGQNGNDTLFGGTGADTLMGGVGNDLIDGGTGNDLLLGADDSGSWNGSNYYRGLGNDTYLFGKGDGQDTIWDVDTTTGNIDTISLKEGVLPSEVRLTRPGNGDHLVLSIAGTTDTLTVGNYFAGDAVGGFAIEQIVFADGTTWDVEAIKARALLSSEAADDISGFASADVINGAGGNDRIWARAGNDTIDAGTGNDQVWGEDGNDSVLGGDGNDSLYGQNGNDTLFGGTGADTLMGGVGNDLIDGGTGNDLLLGADDSGSWNGSNYYRGLGNDTYLFGKGDGQDTIWDVDTTAGNLDTISLKEGVAPEEVRLSRPGNGSHLVLSIAGTTDSVTVGNFFAGDGAGGFGIEQVVFADGTTWDLETIKARSLLSTEAADDISGYATADVINGAGGDDRIWGRAGNDVIDGGAGNDQLRGEDGDDDLRGADGNDALYGENGNDTLGGGIGADTLFGGVGNDVIEGGAGNDLLVGADDSGSWNGTNYYRGLGNDTYRFGRGDGQDTLWDVDGIAGNTDKLVFGADVTFDQLWFQREGNDLAVSIIGTSERVAVKNWYAGNQFHVEQFVAGEGKVLLDTNVQALVNAMASFAPPAAGQTTLPQAYQDQLAPTLAANWVG